MGRGGVNKNPGCKRGKEILLCINLAAEFSRNENDDVLMAAGEVTNRTAYSQKTSLESCLIQ